MTNKKLSVAKPQLAFDAIASETNRFCDMSSLLFIGMGMTGPNMGQHI